jgi:hypothetical protein
LAGVELLAAEPLLELLGVNWISETINIKPLVPVAHWMAATAQGEVFTELMNLVVAAAFADACRKINSKSAVTSASLAEANSPDVCFGSLAAATSVPGRVRFAGESCRGDYRLPR